MKKILKKNAEQAAAPKAKKRVQGDPYLSLSSYDVPSSNDEDGNEQSDYDDKLAMEIDFSDEEDEAETKGWNKNKGAFAEIKQKKEGVVAPFIN